MTSICMWCEEKAAEEIKDKVYWELRDGRNTIEITEVPSFKCNECGIVYQTDEQVKEIEDQLFLIDTKQLEKSLTYQELMEKPRLLKRNYFDFG